MVSEVGVKLKRVAGIAFLWSNQGGFEESPETELLSTYPVSVLAASC